MVLMDTIKTHKGVQGDPHIKIGLIISRGINKLWALVRKTND